MLAGSEDENQDELSVLDMAGSSMVSYEASVLQFETQVDYDEWEM